MRMLHSVGFGAKGIVNTFTTRMYIPTFALMKTVEK